MLKTTHLFEESFGYEAPLCAFMSLDANAVLCGSQDAIGDPGEFDELIWNEEE